MPIMRIFNMLLRPASIVSGGAAGLVFLLVYLGPQFGLRGPYLMMALLVVLILWMAVMFILRLRAQKAGAALEKSIEQQAAAQLASTRPGREEEIEHLKKQLLEAITALKTSRVGKTRGGAGALYVLPWYMIIGPPASGKTTLLANSGLNFPYLDPSRNRPSVKGVGGTRNCDWWFADEAVILDTAGRYVLPVEADDTQEWLAFLDLLRRNRGKKPINGLIVGVSIQDLVMGGEEEVENHAQKIRSRVDELIQRLGISFPIYLVFTKCDLIRGFVEFFGDLSKTERAAVWGATVARERVAQEPATAIFNAEMERLTAALGEARIPRLAQANHPEARPDILFFPLQFHALKDRLTTFVEILFRDNPYHEKPIFRGFYFTSGTQEGRPIDQVINAMLRGFGVDASDQGMTVAPSQTKSYFIENVFSKVMFPDRHIAGPSAEGERRRRSRRAKVFAAGCAGLALLTVGLFFLSATNRKLLSDVKSLSDKAAASAQAGQLSLTLDNVKTLDDLRGKLQTMDDRSRPLTKAALLETYQGERAADEARRLYLLALHDAVMAPVTPNLARNLRQYADTTVVTFPRYYGWYRTWRILQDPAALLRTEDADTVAAVLTRTWVSMNGMLEGQDRDDFGRLLRRQVEYASQYPQVLADLFPPATYRDEVLQQQARAALRRYWTADGVYPGLVEAGKTVPPVKVAGILGGDLGLYGTTSVPGAYTDAAWQEPVKNYLGWLETVRGDWVMREAFSSEPVSLRPAVLARYSQNYVSSWDGFLAGTSAKPGMSNEDTRTFLERSSNEGAPIIRVLKEVDRNTRFDKDSDPALMRIANSFGALHEFFQTPGSGGAMHFLHLPGGGGSNQKAPYLDYIDKVGALAGAYADVVQSSNPSNAGPVLALTSWVDTSISPSDSLTSELARVLKLPASIVTGTVVRGQGSGIQGNWDGVFREFQQALSGRYPFSSNGPDCSIADFERFFGPSGTFQGFYQQNLSGLLSEDGHELPNTGVRFSPAFLSCVQGAYRIRQGCFSGAGAGFNFSLQPDRVDRPGGIVMRGVRVDVGGKSLIYQMGQRVWTPMSWPGQNPEAGASLILDAGSTASVNPMSFSGAWGLFHLLDAAQVQLEGSNQATITWPVPAQPAAITVVFNVRGLSAVNPLQPNFFRFSIPSRVVDSGR